MSKEEKMMILQMVTEGKVTPEQGAELLRAVGGDKPAPPTRVVAGGSGKPNEIRENIQRGIGTAARQAEGFAQKAAEHAGEWASKVAGQADEIARRATSEGENLGRVLGESGENLGRVLGESGENLGKIIGRIFSGLGSDGSQFEFHEELTGELPAEGEIQVDLSTSNGRITVDTWDAPGYRLDVRKVARAATEAEAKELASDGFDFAHNGLSISARDKHLGGNLGFMRSVTVGFTLTLPKDRKATLKLNSSNGRITVGGVSGTRLYANTSNGRVEAEGCNFDNTEVSSANGRIEFEGKPGNFTASTANGRIAARVAGAGEWRLTSANGRIEVEIKREPGIGYSIDVSTMVGKVAVEGLPDAEVLVDETKQRHGSRRYQARTRGYSDAETKASLRANTTVGRVTVSF